MDMSIEMLEKLVSPKDLVTVAVVFFLVKNKVQDHFKSIEGSLSLISSNLAELKTSIVQLEKKQTQRLDDLTKRVDKIEKNKVFNNKISRGR